VVWSLTITQVGELLRPHLLCYEAGDVVQDFLTLWFTGCAVFSWLGWVCVSQLDSQEIETVLRDQIGASNWASTMSVRPLL
jgi:hypothetical protein